MSYTSVGNNKVYASIEDLPENQNIINGDRFLVQTDEGTTLIDYENIKIDLDHTTFGTQITQLVEFTSTAESYITQLQTEFESIQEETTTLKENVNVIMSQLLGCKLLLQHIIGSAANMTDEQLSTDVENKLSGEALSFYQECIQPISNVYSNFRFNTYNLLS